jgi:NDP-4-keto-2,6-dideoxyhexose 3-C-methyltransferase
VTPDLIEAVGEVNPDKFGSFTPGTNIPIVDEAALLSSKPDYLIVLPWHFRAFFESQPRYAGLNLVFPLPELSVGSEGKCLPLPRLPSRTLFCSNQVRYAPIISP